MFEQLFKNLRQKEAVGDVLPLAVPRERARTSTRLKDAGLLDALGQQSERVRERVGLLGERLEDVRSLSEDFKLIVEPLNEILQQHATTRSRLMEVEALLARENELGANIRFELGTLQVTSAKISGELQDALAALADAEEALRQRVAASTEQQIRISDLKSHVDGLESRLALEVERCKALTEDNNAFRKEILASEDATLAAERGLSEANEALSLSQAEVLRLQALTEGLSQKILGLNRTVADLEPQVQAAHSSMIMLEGKLAAEQSARQKLEITREAERAASDVELSSRSMKIDGLNAHIHNVEKLITHLREQLHERSEQLREGEKALRDALADKIAVERDIKAALETSSRVSLQLQEAQRSNVELTTRAEMLTKAIAAKDQALEAASRKTTTLLERIEVMNSRFAADRNEFEAAHRRLIEELQNERAERSLAQGALDIARKSRTSVLEQYMTLKRRAGLVDVGALDQTPDSDASTYQQSESNVMPFGSNDSGVR